MDAQIWANFIAGGFGLAGTVVGTVGLVQARSARAEAKTANEHAERANRIADAANDLSREANQISKDSQERATEHHDVEWEGGWVRPGIYALRNTGTSTTHRGRATVSVDGEEVVEEFESLEAGADLELHFPHAERRHAEEKREKLDRERLRAEARRNPPRSGFGLEPYISEPLEMPSMNRIDVRVVWRSALGMTHEQKFADHFGGLGPE